MKTVFNPLLDAGLDKVPDNLTDITTRSYTDLADKPSIPTLPITEGDVTNLISDLGGKVPNTRSLTINGVAQDMSLDRSWTVSGSVTVKQTEIDFGATPISESSFIITDAEVSPTSNLVGNVAYVAPTGKDLDEIEMDGLDLKFAPGTGQFTLYAKGTEGYISDKFKINYLIG